MESYNDEMEDSRVEMSVIREEDEFEGINGLGFVDADEKEYVSKIMENNDEVLNTAERHDVRLSIIEESSDDNELINDVIDLTTIDESNNNDVVSNDNRELSAVDESNHNDIKQIDDQQSLDNRTVTMEQVQCPEISKDELSSIEEEIELDRKAEAQDKLKPKRSRRKKRTKNPFIAFFLSMYSRRPRQRAADVARQAGRYWGRMSDRQRKIYKAMAGLKIDDKISTISSS